MRRDIITKSLINHLCGIIERICFFVTIMVSTQNTSWLNTISSYRGSIL